jgi:hypothetical protein
MNPITNPRSAFPFLALLLLSFCATAQGEETAGVYFQHGDWEVVCDNTLTCRIAGYCAEEDFANGCASVRITRAAGSDAPLEGQARLADDDDGDGKTPKVLTLWIDGKAKGKLKNPRDGKFALTAAQIRALLAAARKDGAIAFVGSAKSFMLSGKGISAVLLKADEVQGRIGTLGAFIRKGDRSEERVFPPRSKPLIRAAKVGKAQPRKLTAPEFAVLKPLLLQSMKDNDTCWEREQEAAEKKDAFTLTPLDEGHVLISAQCWVAAYNDGYAYWVTDDALKTPPQLVTNSGGSYDENNANGEIYVLQKGRGIADCMNGEGNIWDGQAFRLYEKWTTGMCRGFTGGAWKLPTFVTDVINANGAPRVSD